MFYEMFRFSLKGLKYKTWHKSILTSDGKFSNSEFLGLTF